MSKYNFKLDLSLETSTGLILSKIKPNSIVLEFGSAEGRMTSYMRNELKCKVYIVEYNKDAFVNAISFAEDGICEDIMLFGWHQKFKDIRFDYILFADVLEHLYNPVLVLKKAKELLSEKGEIILSIPNITHNDIIKKMLKNRFDYTSVGLLDDTHIHFWGKDNIIEFVQECNLELLSIEASYCKTGYSEQANNFFEYFPPYIINYLKCRDYGEVYQFIVSMKSNNGSHTFLKSKKYENIKGITNSVRLYFNRGCGFSESDIQDIKTAYDKYTDSFKFNATIDCENTIEIRIDPIEGQPCIVKEFCIIQDNQNIDISYTGYKTIDNIYVLNTDDPQLFIKGLKGANEINISFDYYIKGCAFDKIIENLYNNEVKINNMLLERCKSLEEDLRNECINNENLKQVYTNIINSKTWRYTSFIRKAFSLLRK